MSRDNVPPPRNVSSRRGRWVLGLVAFGLVGSAVGAGGMDYIRRSLVSHYPTNYRVADPPADFAPRFDGADASRPHIAVHLSPVADKLEQPTDIQFPPNSNAVMVVLQKTGQALWVNPATGARGQLFKQTVLTASEEGLLGLAFHPRFAENGKFYLNYVIAENGKDTSRVAEWVATNPGDLTKSTASEKRVLMRVEQPYPNHDAGQLVFGPDGMLYVGWGDGGWRGDPHHNGQNTRVLLGKMLRIDVDHADGGRQYGIPADNPFVNREGFRPELFAYGLRNPWRYTFDPKGRLIIADVGQDKWEEIDIVERGRNYGWNIREGLHCFEPPENCNGAETTDPIYEYSHEEGNSITGGYVYTGARVPALKGKYLFADFVTGRIWAMELPANATDRVTTVSSLGRWPLLISTFGRDNNGEVYAADFSKGTIYRIDP